jgi:hypothetical protein
MNESDYVVARVPLETSGELIVTYDENGVDLHYLSKSSDFTFPLGAPQCEVLEVALRSARLAARKL